MTQIIEDYVSFETAKLLKENGFDDEHTNAFYDKTENLYFIDLLSDLSNHPDNDTDIAASTLYVAMKWLREVHKLHIWIAHKLKQNKGLPWYYEIHNIETGTVVKIGDVICGSYEVACETAIKYCLENLI